MTERQETLRKTFGTPEQVRKVLETYGNESIENAMREYSQEWTAASRLPQDMTLTELRGIGWAVCGIPPSKLNGLDRTIVETAMAAAIVNLRVGKTLPPAPPSKFAHAAGKPASVQPPDESFSVRIAFIAEPNTRECYVTHVEMGRKENPSRRVELTAGIHDSVQAQVPIHRTKGVDTTLLLELRDEAGNRSPLVYFHLPGDSEVPQQLILVREEEIPE